MKGKPIYVVFSGSYSDRSPVGYSHSIDDAEIYCVKKGIENYDVEELFPIGKQTNLEVNYAHEIVFDIKRSSMGFVGTMRNEPTRYSYSDKTSKNKFKTARIGYNWCNWVCFIICTKSRDRELPEKIAQDYFAEFLDCWNNYNIDKACELMKGKIENNA